MAIWELEVGAVDMDMDMVTGIKMMEILLNNKLCYIYFSQLN